VPVLSTASSRLQKLAGMTALACRGALVCRVPANVTRSESRVVDAELRNGLDAGTLLSPMIASLNYREDRMGYAARR
jgi:hypothetical protein